MFAEKFQSEGTVLAVAVGANDQGQSVRVKKAPTCTEATGTPKDCRVLQFKSGPIIPDLPCKYVASILTLDGVA